MSEHRSARYLTLAVLVLVWAGTASAADWPTMASLPNPDMASRGYHLEGTWTEGGWPRPATLHVILAPGFTPESGAGFWGRGLDPGCLDWQYSGPGGSTYLGFICDQADGGIEQRWAASVGAAFMPAVVSSAWSTHYVSVDTTAIWNADGSLRSFAAASSDVTVTIREEGGRLRLESLSPDGQVGERMFFGLCDSDRGAQPCVRRWEVVTGGVVSGTGEFTRWER